MSFGPAVDRREPQYECRRLEAVRRYDILDTPPDGSFDRIAALAARFFDVPVATVSIVDHDRIWFKATHGLDLTEVGRAPGLCSSAVQRPDPYIVTDALRDPRTLENQLVRGELGVRFYAAAPIVTRDGYGLGTVNVIAGRPRPITEDEVATLQDLAAMAADELERRLEVRRTVQLERSRARYQTAVAELGLSAMRSDDPRSVATLARDKAAAALGPDRTVELAWTDESSPGPDDGITVALGDLGVLRARGSGSDGLEGAERQLLRSLADVVVAAVERHRIATELNHLATHDWLTGLPNRRLFLDRLGQVRRTAQRSRERFAVLFFDLDGFKAVNDALGHEAGDEVLRRVADRLRSVIRPGDSLARFGGDEFAMLCPDIADLDAAGLVAQRIHDALAEGLSTAHGTVAITASIGLALGDRATDGTGLLREVDAAMYVAKDAGGNRVAVADPGPLEAGAARRGAAGTAELSVGHDGVAVRHEPTIELADGRIIDVAAMSRTRTSGSTSDPADSH